MNGDQHVGGARLLLADARVAFLLLDEARLRTLARLFGLGRQKSWLASAVAIGVLAEALHDGAARVFRPPASSPADALVGAAIAKETVRGIAGPRANDNMRFLATLVIFAVVAKSVGPAVEGSIRGIEAEARAARAALSRRYGG